MASSSFWSRIAANLWRRADQVPLPAAPRPVRLPDRDDLEPPAAAVLGHAEGQTFMIEYVNASNELSMRRITVHDISEGQGGWPCLEARCHERNAHRRFRVDRIRACIDMNGEIFDDVATFLADTFGMVFPTPGQQAALAEAYAEWQEIAKDLRPEAVLLAAMARSDGVTLSCEVLTAAERIAVAAERRGHFMRADHVTRLENLIRRTRPTKNALARALETALSYPPERSRDLLLAAFAVMEADGRRHPAEIAFLNEIATEITGVPIIES